MTKIVPLVNALKLTAAKLSKNTTRYQWGHMGQCNVGHLVQTMTGMESVEIVKSIDCEMNEWTEHARSYCSKSGHKVEDLFDTMKQFGFGPQDVIHLENLSDRSVLENLPGGFRYLRKNSRDDVIEYMLSLADFLAKAA